uniref:Uncharacterized protein n=1 Tax=Anopheles maculatus TaxID=74869 RepID=A0A182SX25_9DIPT
MVTHMKPPVCRMYHVTLRLLIFAVLFLNSFIDLATIDGHVLPRPLANTTTTSSAPVRNVSTAGSDNIATIISATFADATQHMPHGQPTEATDNQHTRGDPHTDMLNSTAGRVLVVAPENFSIDQLRQGFNNFVELLQTNRPPAVSDSDNLTLPLFDKLIQFRSWRGKFPFREHILAPIMLSKLSGQETSGPGVFLVLNVAARYTNGLN